MKLQLITLKDEFRPALMHVCIDKENIVATNAFCLIKVPKSEFCINAEDMPECFITSKDWAKLAKGYFMLKFEDGHIISVKDGIFEEIARIKPILKEDTDFKFPDVDKVIPIELDLQASKKIFLSKKRLLNLVAAMPTSIDDLTISLHGNRGVVLKDKSGESKAIGLIMPLHSEEDTA